MEEYSEEPTSHQDEEHIGYLLEDDEQVLKNEFISEANGETEKDEFICIEQITENVVEEVDDGVEYIEEEIDDGMDVVEEDSLEEQGIIGGEQQWEMLEEDAEVQLDEQEQILSHEQHYESDNELPQIKQEFLPEEILMDATQYVIEEPVGEEVVYNEQYLEEQQENVLEIDGTQLEQVFIKMEPESVQYEEQSEDNANKFYCYECKGLFADLDSAEQHDCAGELPDEELENTITKTLWPCSHCRSAFDDAESLERHHRNCQQKSPRLGEAKELKCAHCDKVFYSQKTLYSHARVHRAKPHIVNVQQVTCPICNTIFSSEKNLKLHIKIHNKRPSKTIQEALPAGAHTQYNELNQFYCEICNKSFDQNLLAIHKNMHQNIEEYICGVCNRQFENLPSYEMHLQLHADKPEYRRTVTSSNNVPTKSDGGSASGKKLRFPCQYCGRDFARPYEKVKHERVHTGEKPYECEVCGKTFRVSYSLTLHLRTHTDIRPFVCATCNKRFKSQPVYAHHLGTHLAERPYKCDVCPKTFRTSVQLCGHKNSHRKPFNCTECNRPFATLYAVKIHMKTHNKANKSNENLKHRCGICGAVYARIFALRYHMKDMHALEVDTKALIQSSSSDGIGNDDAALLIAAAAEANVAHDDENVDDEDGDEEFQDENELDDETHAATRHLTQDAATICYSEQTILQNEEIIVDSFHTEEIVADWLAN